MSTHNKTILVIGATGYIGSELTADLLKQGYHVRAAGRSTERLAAMPWAGHENLTTARVDVLDPDTLDEALKNVDVAYYLVHSMNPQSKDFEKDDRTAARNMVRLARDNGIKRIIYLGGLGEEEAELSKHLRSRHEVSEILMAGTVPTTVLRAAMVIGEGSVSFQILGYLVKRLPVMITPKWVRTPNQPIAVDNVITYLTGCLEKEETTGEVYDIGGEEVLSYEDLIHIYAQVAGLNKRFIIPVPVLTPYLSSLWINLVTPIPGYIARPLTEGLRNPVVCRDQRIRQIIPQKLLTSKEAIIKAIT